MCQFSSINRAATVMKLNDKVTVNPCQKKFAMKPICRLALHVTYGGFKAIVDLAELRVLKNMIKGP